jgi:hypothetical protein
MSLVGEGTAARMALHVRVRLDAGRGALDRPSEADPLASPTKYPGIVVGVPGRWEAP